MMWPLPGTIPAVLAVTSTKPNLVAKILATYFGDHVCIGYQNNINAQFHHLVNTGLNVDSLVKWLPNRVAHTCKLNNIWVVYSSLIGNGSIRL